MNMSSVITQMAVLFLVLALGYIGNKSKILNSGSNRLLSGLVLNITMPCTILYSVMNGAVTTTDSEVLKFVLLALVSFALTYLIAWPVPRLLRSPREDYGLTRFLLAFGNVAFMGYPVIQAIYGDGAMFYVTLFNIPFNLLLFSLGIILTSGKREKLSLKFFLTPTLIISFVSVLIFAFNVAMPKIIVDTTSLVGHMTTPAAMLIIGSTLAEIPVRDVFTELRIYPVAFIKLIMIPVVTWLVLRLFVTDAHTLTILTVEAAMPTATAAAMLSLQYGGNDKLASKGVFITTLFSVVTIPLLLYLLF
jgi:malate permease and related proteins